MFGFYFLKLFFVFKNKKKLKKYIWLLIFFCAVNHKDIENTKIVLSMFQKIILKMSFQKQELNITLSLLFITEKKHIYIGHTDKNICTPYPCYAQNETYYR